jgi:lysylphosphatidylglycerol synthetase-like protein (DUF2156 family)
MDHVDFLRRFTYGSRLKSAVSARFSARCRNALFAGAPIGQDARIESLDRESDMFGQIILNTPPWVWALLAFLIYRGIRSASDRDIRFGRVFIIPLVMLGLSLHGIALSFGAGVAVMLTWLAFAIVAGLLAWHFSGRRAIVAHPDRGMIFQPGSWTPLMLMMGIFFTKYVVAVMLLRHPDYAQHAGFVFTICALYGMFNGIFIGNLLRVIAIYRQATAALSAISRETSNDWASQKF